jgi:hypothetical protein
MYPARQLSELERAKHMVRLRIARDRSVCVVAARDITLPLAWADQAVAFWRNLPEWTRWVSVPAGLLLTRLFSRTLRPWGGLRRWIPTLVGIAQRFWR